MGPAQKKSSPVIPILIVVVLIAVGVGAFVLLSGGDDEAGSDPAATVEALYNADNCESLGDILSSESLETMGGQQAALEACQTQLDEQGGIMAEEGAELVSTEVTSEEESSATVAVELRMPDGETSNVDHELVKEDGEWKVNLMGGSGSTPPPSGDDGGGSGPPDASTPDTSLPTDDGSGSGSDDGSGGSDGGGTGGGGAAPPMDDPTGQPEDFTNAEACQGGNMAACDDLYWDTEVGSDLEAYGRSCGGLDTSSSRPGGNCEEEFG
jgi:hypothetical protein